MNTIQIVGGYAVLLKVSPQRWRLAFTDYPGTVTFEFWFN